MDNLKELRDRYMKNERIIEKARARRVKIEQAIAERIGVPLDVVISDGSFIAVTEPPAGADVYHYRDQESAFDRYSVIIDGVEVKCFKDVEP